MKLYKDHRIVWLIRGLATTGILMVVVTQCLISWTFAHIRNERTQAGLQQQQLNLASDQLAHLTASSQSQIQSSLDDAAVQTSDQQAVTAFTQFIVSQLRSHPDPTVLGPLVDLDKQLKRLTVVSNQCAAWRAEYNVVWEDISQERTMGRVRAVIAQLRDSLNDLQGKHRLDDAIQFRQWRNAAGDQADQDARQILQNEGRKQTQSAADFGDQLSELARLAEVLGGVEQFDSLADLKDNQLKPVLDRMSRSIGVFAGDPANDGVLSPKTMQDLNAALFGDGFVIDQAHQSILAPGGLFMLRSDALRLRREREDLRRNVTDLFQNIEQTQSHFGQLAQARAEALAQEVERSVAEDWQRILIFGAFGVIVFLWLTFHITRGIYGQVNAIEQARAEAESGRQVTQKLMLEQMAAATELENVHKQLVDASRQAGMAEVATGVLHNVGNVLNSVNISTNVIKERVSQSRVGNLSKASAMIETHREDLAAFLTSDEKGKRLPDYFMLLAKELGDENTAVLDELKNLAKGIEHIKDVVQFQQDYAKSSTFRQRTNPASLIEDALRINLLSLERHNIEIVRDVPDLGEIDIDKHKILQVLINLISNAKNALARSGHAGERRITLRLTATRQESGMTLRFEVSDTGVGISPAGLDRIFTHGFTTRTTGHGFGLHTSANAAREMNGALSAFSDGAGKGATFVLEVPVAPTKAAIT